MDAIKLAPPNLEKGLPIMRALQERKTSRSFSDQKLPLQQLSEILWAADGITHDNKRSAPSAVAMYPVEVYAILDNGIYLYDPAEHQLQPIAGGDFRKEVGPQPFVASSPLNLIYVGNFEKLAGLPAWASTMTRENKLSWMFLEAGHKVENVYLYSVSENLNVVIRGRLDEENIRKALNLGLDQVVLCAQTVGYPA